MNRNISIMQSLPTYETLYFKSVSEIETLTYHIQELYQMIENLEKEIETLTEEKHQ